MSTSLCAVEGSTSLQVDIAGPILRVSTYVLALLAVAAAAVSPALNELYHRVFPFVIVNVVVLASALFFGSSSRDGINLQDTMVAWMLVMGPTVMFLMVAKRRQNACLTSGICRQILEFVTLLCFLDILLVVISLTAYHHPEQFGISEDCHEATRTLIIRTFNVNHSWILSATMLGGIIHCSLFFQSIMRLTMRQPNTTKEKQMIVQGDKEAISADYGWGARAFIFLSILAFFTEDMIARKSIAPPDGSFWKFGQILPLLLTAIPLTVPRRQLLNLESHYAKDKVNDFESNRQGM